MLTEEPLWIFSSKSPLTQWYGHVHLLPERVVGQWFVLQRGNGSVLWQRPMWRANSIHGFDSGVIVASETRSDGPWTADFGCYGISLEDGRLLWTAHREGLLGVITRLMDFIPGITNALRDSPHHVMDGKVFCYSGRVLNVIHGCLLERQNRKTIEAFKKPESVALQFYNKCGDDPKLKVAIGQRELWLSHLPTEPPGPRPLKEFLAQDENGQTLWRLSLNKSSRYIDGNFYSFRLVPPYLYLVISVEKPYGPNGPKRRLQPKATLWRLMTIHLADGEIAQDISLGPEKHADCRIEDLDDAGLLISQSRRDLLYFLRAEPQPSL